eukprot:1158276-Pelagomonas_calceolata.AAC.4
MSRSQPKIFCSKAKLQSLSLPASASNFAILLAPKPAPSTAQQHDPIVAAVCILSGENRQLRTVKQQPLVFPECRSAFSIKRPRE